jgi:hypothetical protein
MLQCLCLVIGMECGLASRASEIIQQIDYITNQQSMRQTVHDSLGPHGACQIVIMVIIPVNLEFYLVHQIL